MKKETINSKQASRRKAGKLKLNKETIKDLKTLDEKAGKIKGGHIKTDYDGPCCDRNMKENFVSVDVKEVLAHLSGVCIQKWNYKIDDPTVIHISPMAQDFAAAFGVGEDDKHIHPIDVAGVAFAAIQALLQMIRQQAAEVNSLRAEMNELRERMMVTL